jgi:hypothetical protein
VDELKKRLIYWRKKTQNVLGVYPDSVLFPKLIEDYDENYESEDETKTKDPSAVK